MRKHIEDAAVARSNLNIFYAVMGALENGTIRGASADRAARRIIDICKKEAGAQLKAMDAAIEKAEKGSK